MSPPYSQRCSWALLLIAGKTQKMVYEEILKALLRAVTPMGGVL
jgi:hypothetical protein